jgi:hypothetical protein
MEVQVPGELTEGAPATPTGPEAPVETERPVVMPDSVPDVELSGQCAICLSDQSRVNPLVVAPILCDVLDAIPAQIKIELRRGQGVLAQEVDRASAEKVVRRLSQKDVKAFAVDQAHVPRVGRRIKIVRVHGLSPDVLRLQSDLNGTVRELPTSAVAAAFCTRKKQTRGGPTELKTVYVDGGAVGHARRTYRAKSREAKPEAQCTLLVEGKSGQIYAIGFKESQVRYSYLKGRLKPSSSQNFCTLMADLMEKCEGAFFPEAMASIAKGQFNAVMDIEADTGREKYEQWVLCCLARRWHGAVESG